MTKDLRGTSDTSNIKVKVKFFPALLDKMSLNCCQSWTRTYKLPWTVLFESPWTMLFELPWTTRKGDRHLKHQTDAMIAWKAINSTSSPSASNDMLLDCKVLRRLTQEARLEDILCVIAIIRRSVCLEWHAKIIPQKNSAPHLRRAHPSVQVNSV